ncbi:hypothetical protein BV20DRAFT_318560 [Pilatotrama ljubarskyi]|nr:hypothetical protein BV20DRAFT_318560 [Pilatotrama ljubarskyi]
MMQMRRSLSAVLLAVAIGGAYARDPHPSSGQSPPPVPPISTSDTLKTAPTSIPVPPCVINCLSEAARTAGCSSFSDTACVCRDRFALPTIATPCLTGCPPSDVGWAQAQELLSQTCDSPAPSSGGLPPPIPTSEDTDPSRTTDPATSHRGPSASGPAAPPPISGTASAVTLGNTPSATPASPPGSTATPGGKQDEGASPSAASDAAAQSDAVNGTRPAVVVTKTLTDDGAMSTSNELNPPANGAATPRLAGMQDAGGVLVAGLIVLASGVGLLL